MSDQHPTRSERRRKAVTEWVAGDGAAAALVPALLAGRPVSTTVLAVLVLAATGSWRCSVTPVRRTGW